MPVRAILCALCASVANMKLTALIPVYNDDYALSLCLASIVDHFDEIIIFDDASDDLTSNVCDEFTDRYDHVRCETNLGRQLGWVEARNRLAAMTDLEHLFWLDSDDVLCEYNAHLLREIAEGATPIVRLCLTEMWGDFYHTTGRLTHHDRCHVYQNRRLAPCIWTGAAAARLAPQCNAATKNGPGPLFFHLKGVKPDRRLVERGMMRGYLRAQTRPERLSAHQAIAGLTETQIHHRAVQHLLTSRIDHLVPTWVGGGIPPLPPGEGGLRVGNSIYPRRPEVIERAPDRFLMVYKDGIAVDREDKGWPARPEAGMEVKQPASAQE